MSDIKKLLKDVEVEWRNLGDLATLKRGRVMSKIYLAENKGIYPVYSSQTANNGQIGKISTFDFDRECLTWTTDGANAGTVFYRSGKFSITNVCGLIQIKDEEYLDYKYLFYWLSIEAKSHVYSGMGNPKLMSNQVSRIPIPIPPLSVQKEIVRILDTFTGLTAELKTELIARKKQFTHYRDQLLSFEGQDVEWKPLGEVSSFINGRAYKRSELLNEGKYTVLRVGNFFSNDNWYYSDLELPADKYCDNGDLLYAWSASFGPRIWGGDKVIYHYHIWKVIPKVNIITKRFLFHLLDWDVTSLKNEQATGSTMLHITKGAIEKRLVPVPSLEEQKRIVTILDKFDTLTTSKTEGLPAEIEMRQKQYEYYRDLLLTFPTPKD